VALPCEILCAATLGDFFKITILRLVVSQFPKILKTGFGNYPLVPIFAVLFATRAYF
jgi:hypothetical protein